MKELFTASQTQDIIPLFSSDAIIDDMNSNINDLLIMGNTMYGSNGYITISDEVKNRYKDLEEKRDSLKKKIKNINSANRDFSDVMKSNDNKTNESSILFLEDYTIFFLAISYLFMILIFIYLYTYAADNKLYAFFKNLFAVIIFTVVFGMLMYNVA